MSTSRGFLSVCGFCFYCWCIIWHPKLPKLVEISELDIYNLQLLLIQKIEMSAHEFLTLLGVGVAG